jgi:hypothetical protein
VGASGFVDVALALLEAGATAGDKAGAAVLVSACSLGSAELVAQLLAAGADANAKALLCYVWSSEDRARAIGRCSALYVAVRSSSEVMALLLAAGADPDAGGFAQIKEPGFITRWVIKPETPLGRAIGCKNGEKVNQLLEAGARLTVPLIDECGRVVHSADLAKFTVPLIKAVLKLRGLKMGGAKHEMLERLRNAYA